MTCQGLKPADDNFVRGLKEILPDGSFADFDIPFGVEPRGLFTCEDAMLIEPGNVGEVSRLLAACNRARVPVIAYGGGTGLVGGQVGHDLPRPVVVSMRRMNRVRERSEADRVITVEAGCILHDVQEEAAAMGLVFPLSIPSAGTCRIGGNLATNAGGSSVLRYGSMRDMCLGIEAVFADGQVWSRLDALHKDNHGYDLRNLLIGSEGTLAILTAATLKLFPQPVSSVTCLLALAHLGSAPAVLATLRSRLGDTISAFELISGTGLRFILDTGLRASLPMTRIPDWMILTTIECGHGCNFQGEVEGVIDTLLDEGPAVGGIIATSERQHRELWALRECIPEANRLTGAVSSHDISVPVSAIGNFIQEAETAVGALGPYQVNCFGHYGDGNLHFNVFPKSGAGGSGNDHDRDAVADCVYELVSRYGGSISAEHGTGRLKAGRLRDEGCGTYYTMVKSIKHSLDPHGIMNPGAVIERQ